MSSTKRKSDAEQAKDRGYHPTPQWVVHRLLDELDLTTRHGRWLEPCAGNGELINGVTSWFDSRPARAHNVWTAVEIEQRAEDPSRLAKAVGRGSLGAESPSVVHADFLHWKGGIDLGSQGPHVPPYMLCIMNPPFHLAVEMLIAASRWSREIVLLQRLNWLGTVPRNGLLRRNMPDVYVVPDRVSFDGTGSTDSVEQAWFHWPDVREVRRAGRIQVLDTTDQRERKKAQQRQLEMLAASNEGGQDAGEE